MDAGSKISPLIECMTSVDLLINTIETDIDFAFDPNGFAVREPMQHVSLQINVEINWINNGTNVQYDLVYTGYN